jgi:hypothetical protein
MNGKICYLNTDHDLVSAENLTSLAAAMKANGVTPLHVTCGDDGLWRTTLETDIGYTEAEPNIVAMVNAIERLQKPLRAKWGRCTLREFNIGYDCGYEPWAFHQGLSSDTLSRIAAIGASLRITLYPERPMRNRRIEYKEEQMAKVKPKRDEKREKRIDMEILVDCYEPSERLMGWYYYLESELKFPFKAECIAKWAISPLKIKEVVEVIGLPKEDECKGEMFVLIRHGDVTMGAPLAQLKPKRGTDAQTKQAVEDWHYWAALGYQF